MVSQILPLPAGDARRRGIGRQLLLQAQSTNQPVQQRMVEVQRQPKLADQQGDEIVAPGVDDLVGQNGPALCERPGGPIGRQQEHRPTPADRGRRGQIVRLANLDRPATAQFRAKRVDQLQ